MNQGRIWCVVSPNVGLPLLLGSVAVTSLIVHTCVMTHTTWMSNYWQGAVKPKTAMADSPNHLAANTDANGAFSVSITPVASADAKGETAFVVTVSPNGVPHAVASTTPAGKLALAEPKR